MKKIAFALIGILSTITCLCQPAAGKLVFQQAQNIGITLELKGTVAQDAMGQNIDFKIEGTAAHLYKVTNATEDNNTLHHEIKRVTFKFDGMGQKPSFDSDVKKDLDGFFGAPVKDILNKTYDMVIDPTGKALLVKPEKIELAKVDERLTIVFNMLRDLTTVVYPPKKGEASFFKVLPDSAIALNGTWTQTGEDANGKFATVYTLSAITDSTMVIDFKGTSVSVAQAEMMGMQTTTKMNHNHTGKIILDKATGLIREKTINTESNGATTVMGNNLPVTSKTTVIIRVNRNQ
jgi:hypothetical protein